MSDVREFRVEVAMMQQIVARAKDLQWLSFLLTDETHEGLVLEWSEYRVPALDVSVFEGRAQSAARSPGAVIALARGELSRYRAMVDAAS